MKAHVHIHRMLAVYPGLDNVQQRVVDEHIALCPACAEVRSAYQAMDQTLAGLEDARLPLALACGWSVSFRTERRPNDFPRWSIPTLMQRIVLPLVILLILACGVWVLVRLSTPRSPGIAGTPSVTPSATPVVLASRPPDALAMAAHPLPQPALDQAGSVISPGSSGRPIAAPTKTPVPWAISNPASAPAYHQDPPPVWNGLPVVLELPLTGGQGILPIQFAGMER
jgi:hypothetical protein